MGGVGAGFADGSGVGDVGSGSAVESDSDVESDSEVSSLLSSPALVPSEPASGSGVSLEPASPIAGRPGETPAESEGVGDGLTIGVGGFALGVADGVAG